MENISPRREKKIHKSYKAEHKNTNIPTFRESLNNNRLNLGRGPRKREQKESDTEYNGF